MATPMLRALSGSDATVRAPQLVHQLLESPEHVYSRLDGQEIKGFARLLEEARRLRAMKFGSAMLVNRSFRMALLAKLARIPIRIGHATEGRSALLTHPIRYNPDHPEAESYAQLLEPLGVKVQDLSPRLRVTVEERAAGLSRLAGIQIGIQPAARYPEKQLPAEALSKLTDRFAAERLSFALFGGPDERSSLDGGLDLIGKLSLRESMGAAANLRALIGGDTGFMHVAAAVGCPTITVFGPTNSAKWGHFDSPHQVIQAPGANMANITGDEVWEAVRGVLAAS